MQTLDLILPQHSRLEKNAEKPILNIIDSIKTIRTVCSEFSAANDNRAKIKALYETLGVYVEALADVDDRDQEKAELGAAYSEARNQYSLNVAHIGQRLRNIATEEEGTKLPQRRMNKALAELRSAIGSFNENNDTRPAAVIAIGEIRSAVADVMLLDLTLDAWYAKQVYASCDALLRVMEQAIPPPPAPQPRGTHDSQRTRALDAAQDLKSRAGGIAYRYFQPLDEAAPIGVKLDAIRKQISSDLFMPIENAAEIAAEVREIKAEISRLRNVYVPVGEGSRDLLNSGVRQATDAADALLTILEPPTVSAEPAPSLIGRFRNLLPSSPNFGWES